MRTPAYTDCRGRFRIAECGMKNQEKQGFSYYLTDEQIKRYQKMPIEKRLEWLYLGNLLRKAFSEQLFDVWDKLRERKI